MDTVRRHTRLNLLAVLNHIGDALVSIAEDPRLALCHYAR
jgi:hypothetical protein